jgi:hypothetical protein
LEANKRLKDKKKYNKMSCLLENSDKLEFHCPPDCYHKGGKSYVIGQWGKTSPYPTRNIEPPKNVRFTVILKVDDETLYQAIGSWLEEFNDDEIDVTSSGSRCVSYKLEGIKDEYKEAYQLGLEDYNRKVARLEELIKEIEALNLGNWLVELEHTTNSYNCPEEWYKKTYMNSSYTVCCHHKTRFYNWLKENGFLEKYVPASWYE